MLKCGPRAVGSTLSDKAEGFSLFFFFSSSSSFSFFVCFVCLFVCFVSFCYVS